MNIQDIHEKADQTQPQRWDKRLAPWFANKVRYEEWLNEHHYYLYLGNLVKVTKPKKIIELGTLTGGSTIFMIIAMPKACKLFTFDNNPDAGKPLQSIIDQRVTFILADDLDANVRAQYDLAGTDFLFMDTEHEYDHVAAEWEAFRPYLNPGALVVMDDININKGMRRFWDNLPYDKVDTGAAYHWSGFGIFQYT